MPVALQVLLIAVLLWYTETRFDGFINRANLTTVLLLAMPLALAAIAQTHAILVGYLDLSVGAMISFGVVVGSFLIAGDASTIEILIGIATVLACGLGPRLGQRSADQRLQDPVAHRHPGDTQHSRRDLADHATHRTGDHQRRPGVVSQEERGADPHRVHRHRRRRRPARSLAARLGTRPRGARSRFRRSFRQARRDQDQLDSGASTAPVRRSCCRRLALRHGSLADRERSDR